MSKESKSHTFSKSLNELIDFSQLLLGFSSAALLYLGEGAPSTEGQTSSAKAGKVNLPLAKYNIDIIELLKNKTEGNLTPDEERLVKQILTDLWAKYSALSPHKS